MIQKFFTLPSQVGPSTVSAIFNTTPASAAAEATDAIEYLTVNG